MEELAEKPFESLTPQQQQLLQDVARQQMERIRRLYEGTPLWLKAPNGQPSKLNEQQWLQVRTPLFKRWFGDWEAVAHKTRLDADTVSTLTGDEFQKQEGLSIIDRVSEWFSKKHNGKAINKQIGEVILDRRSVKNSWSHGGGKAKAAAFAAVPDVIEKGQIISFHKNWKERGYDTIVLSAPVQIAREKRILIVVVEKRKDNRFYLHEAFLKEDLQGDGLLFQTGAFQSSGASLGDLHKIVQKIFSVNPDSVSKVVDENGEPLDV